MNTLIQFLFLIVLCFLTIFVCRSMNLSLEFIIYVVLSIIACFFAILAVFISKSNKSRVIQIIFILLTLLFIPITNAFFDTQSSDSTFGKLKPRNPNAEFLPSITIHTAYKEKLCTFDFYEKRYIYPVGNAPFVISRDVDGLIIKAKVFSLDNKIVATLENNKWKTNPNNYFRLYKDESSLEIIDEYDIPILQVEYIDVNNVRIGGVFKSLNEKDFAEIYSDFPQNNDFRGFLVIREGGVTIIGKTFSFGNIPKNTKDLDDMTIKCRKILKPWFVDESTYK